MEESTIKRQRGKDGVSSATLAGRLSHGILPTGGRDGGGGGGCTAEERRGERGPEGYLPGWIAPVLNIVKEIKKEIS